MLVSYACDRGDSFPFRCSPLTMCCVVAGCCRQLSPSGRTVAQYLASPVVIHAFVDFSSHESRALLLSPDGLRATLIDAKTLTPEINFALIPISSNPAAPGRQMNEAVACALQHVGSSKKVLPMVACLVSTYDEANDDLNLFRLSVCVDPVLRPPQVRLVQACISSGHGGRLLSSGQWELENSRSKMNDLVSLPRVVLNHEVIPCTDGRCDLFGRVCRYLYDNDDCWVRTGRGDLTYEYKF